MSLVKNFLKYKMPKIAEIELTLFENCDIVCSFCGNEKESTYGMNESDILAKLDQVKKCVESFTDSKRIHLHLVGGELLQDRLIDSGFLDIYLKLINNYSDYCKSISIEPIIVFATNNVHNRQLEVKQFFDNIKKIASLVLVVSYDSTGRPITSQYKKNIDYFSDYISNINMVCTCTTIRNIISGNDKYFADLYCRFSVHIDDFLPDKHSEHLIPSDTEFLNFMLYCYHNYPNVYPYGNSAKALKNNDIVSINSSTINKFTILPNGVINNYVWDRHSSDSFNMELNRKDNSNMLENFLYSNNCLSCKYYDSCHLRCPVQWSWKNRKRNEKCVNLEFFEFIDKE